MKEIDKSFIEDLRIVINYTNMPIYVYERDDYVHPSYVLEKLEIAQQILANAIASILTHQEDQDDER